VGQADLQRILAGIDFYTHPGIVTSIAAGDDAGVIVLTPELALIQTVDLFTPVVDDPRTYGRIAAANSLSDVYAMGGTPLTALAVLAIPAKDFPEWVPGEIMAGANEVAREANAPIVGGHSLKLPEPAFGLAVTGMVHPDKLVTADGAQPGDALVLTKPLGTGIITTAAMAEKAPAEALEAATAAMQRLNRAASEAMQKLSRVAATDVTGFGLLGHLSHILLGSGVAARLELARVPLIPGALELADEFIPGGTAMNYKYAKEFTDFGPATPQQKMLLCDAQTSGGLLVACPPDEAESYLNAVAAAGCNATIIGALTEPGEKLVTVV